MKTKKQVIRVLLDDEIKDVCASITSSGMTRTRRNKLACMLAFSYLHPKNPCGPYTVARHPSGLLFEKPKKYGTFSSALNALLGMYGHKLSNQDISPYMTDEWAACIDPNKESF